MKDELLRCDCENCELKELFYYNVDSQEIEHVCHTKKEEYYSKGEVIVSEGDPILKFAYLKSGLVKLYKEGNDGKGQIFMIAKPFDFVSLLSAFSYDNYNYSVMAIEDSITCNLNLEDLKRMINENGEFAMSIMKKMSRVSDMIILENLTIRRKNLQGRVAYILLYFADNIYGKDEFELPLSRREIAEFIGKTTENVIRAMSEFRKDGIIKIYGKMIEIVDKGKLKRVAEFG